MGCGDGEFALGLVKRSAIVTGIDASPAMIDAARRRAKQHGVNIVFQVAMAQHLPFPAEQFDIVTAITILCFVEDAAPVFREIARVLQPGGRLVIGELGKWSPWAAGRRIRAWFGSPLWRQGRFWTARELRDLAGQAGLVVESVRGAVYYPRWVAAARWLSPYDSLLSRLTTLGPVLWRFPQQSEVAAEDPMPDLGVARFQRGSRPSTLGSSSSFSSGTAGCGVSYLTSRLTGISA